MCDAFLNEKLPMPDYTIGVSAGIAYGVSYLSRQKRRNLQLLMHYANDRRYMAGGISLIPGIAATSAEVRLRHHPQRAGAL